MRIIVFLSAISEPHPVIPASAYGKPSDSPICGQRRGAAFWNLSHWENRTAKGLFCRLRDANRHAEDLLGAHGRGPVRRRTHPMPRELADLAAPEASSFSAQAIADRRRTAEPVVFTSSTQTADAKTNGRKRPRRWPAALGRTPPPSARCTPRHRGRHRALARSSNWSTATAWTRYETLTVHMKCSRLKPQLAPGQTSLPEKVPEFAAVARRRTETVQARAGLSTGMRRRVAAIGRQSANGLKVAPDRPCRRKTKCG